MRMDGIMCMYTHSQIKNVRDNCFNYSFDYRGDKTTYFYGNLGWVPHDITRFDHYDSCIPITE